MSVSHSLRRVLREEGAHGYPRLSTSDVGLPHDRPSLRKWLFGSLIASRNRGSTAFGILSSLILGHSTRPQSELLDRNEGRDGS